ncbi:hypothetical protein JS528_02185 [Bifidobacterium sp. MA2]|uniref:histidine kinase n=1 Tax=Bifidobacterium santillanense TaxID=2809028 RepID=A0ABS5UMS8_9BIFI|nr:histidine kinase [Bifidobacterium santillanense]MBT1172186.1 hypothetical protein [Bifidobacterium santillanense]
MRRTLTARLMRGRPVMMFAAALMAAETVYEMIVYPAHLPVTTVLSVVHIACVLALPWAPRAMGAGVIATFLACCPLPDTGGPSLLFGTWLALVALGLHARSWRGWLWPALVSAARAAKFTIDGFPFDYYASLIMLFVVSYALGRMLAWRDAAASAERDRLRYERTRQRVETMRRESRAASRIHDSVANNLAYMAMRLDYERTRDVDDRTTELIDDLYDRAIDTLGEVRAVIDMLDVDAAREPDDDGGSDATDPMTGHRSESDSDDSDRPIDRGSSFPDRMRAGMTRGDRYLSRLGFTGDSTMIDDSRSTADAGPSCDADGTGISDGAVPSDEGMSREREDAAVALLRELYTNIAVHADRRGEYHVIARRTADGIDVDEVNDDAGPDAFPDKPSSGRGLAMHRRRFASLGGVIRTSREDGTWILHAHLPA